MTYLASCSLSHPPPAANAGLLMQFQLFLKNSYGILFFLFFLFQLAMSSLAMLVCTLMHKTSVAVYVGFAVFLLGE